MWLASRIFRFGMLREHLIGTVFLMITEVAGK